MQNGNKPWWYSANTLSDSTFENHLANDFNQATQHGGERKLNETIQFIQSSLIKPIRAATGVSQAEGTQIAGLIIADAKTALKTTALSPAVKDRAKEMAKNPSSYVQEIKSLPFKVSALVKKKNKSLTRLQLKEISDAIIRDANQTKSPGESTEKKALELAKNPKKYIDKVVTVKVGGCALQMF